MNISAKAWKMNQEGVSNCLYRMQINGLNATKQERKISLDLIGWQPAGNGFNPNTGEMILFFSRDFGTTEKWLQWAKTFEGFKLDELDMNGDIKKYVKIGLRLNKKIDPKTGSITKSTRQCSMCGKYGHNARSCGTERTQKPIKTAAKTRKKRVEKGPRKCGACGSIGHNARKCPNK